MTRLEMVQRVWTTADCVVLVSTAWEARSYRDRNGRSALRAQIANDEDARTRMLAARIPVEEA